MIVGGQPVGPKETKPDSPEQQDIDNYLKQGFSLPEAIRKSAADRQPPQRPPQVNLIVPGPGGTQTLQTVRPGQAVPSGAVTPTQFGPEQKKEGDAAATANATVGSFTRYQQGFHDLTPKLTPQDREAMQVLTSHSDKIAGGFLESAQSGVLDTLMGQPLTGYSQKLMGGAMTKDQYDKLSPAGKQMLAHYFNAVIQNFGNMKQILGSIGRNPMQLQAEINTIPLPYLDPQTADAMFSDKLQDIQTRNRNVRGFGNSGGGAVGGQGGGKVLRYNPDTGRLE
jgi:hypothetical protein